MTSNEILKLAELTRHENFIKGKIILKSYKFSSFDILSYDKPICKISIKYSD